MKNVQTKPKTQKKVKLKTNSQVKTGLKKKILRLPMWVFVVTSLVLVGGIGAYVIKSSSAATVSCYLSTATTVKYGDTGSCVKVLQHSLNRISNTGLTEDGQFGAKTKAATINYQRSRGLVQDGVVGPITWAKIKMDFSSVNRTINGTVVPLQTSYGNSYIRACIKSNNLVRFYGYWDPAGGTMITNHLYVAAGKGSSSGWPNFTRYELSPIQKQSSTGQRIASVDIQMDNGYEFYAGFVRGASTSPTTQGDQVVTKIRSTNSLPYCNF